MKPGDLVVHIGARPSGYRIRLVCAIEHGKEIIFADGRRDLKGSWRVFDGWGKNESR